MPALEVSETTSIGLEPTVGTLTIEGFRALRKLKMEGLGRVNLITGRNNTGKSSVLEALRIMASDASLSVIFDILRSREEEVVDAEGGARPLLDADVLFDLSPLFHGFPKFSCDLPPIVVESSGEGRAVRICIGTGSGPGQGSMLLDGVAPALVVETGSGPRTVPLESFRRDAYRARALLAEFAGEPRLPCVFVSPYGGERTASLAKLWDGIALSDLEEDVVEALHIIDPGISAVSMVGGEGPGRPRTAIVRAAGIPRPVPLRSFGDGLNRLFGIVLSLVNAKDGLLLIDEFENGMHHTVQADTWRAIFRLAGRLNVQVFATSHSWDAVEAFQEAAAEDPAEGVLLRLTRRGDDVIPTLFREHELAIATRDRIEVR